MTPSYTTRVYATTIFSDVDLPLAVSEEVETRQELTLHRCDETLAFGKSRCSMPLYRAHGRTVRLHTDRKITGSEKGQPWCYEVEGVVRFYWKSAHNTLCYELLENGNVQLLSFWLVHLFLPLYFTLEGVYEIFHGGAVESEGGALMFAAPSMGGKSTMIDYFLRRGHSLVSDDKIATLVEGGEFRLVPSHPYHRPYRKFEVLGDLSPSFSSHSCALHALYLLDRNEEGAEITIEELHGFEKFNALRHHYLYPFDFLRLRRFRYLSRILDSVPVFRIRRPWSIQKIPDVYEAILEHRTTIKRG